MNWAVLWVVGRAPSVWSDAVRDELVLARMGSMAAAPYANYGTGRSPALTWN